MKKIAITPDELLENSLLEKIAELKTKGATHLYLRSPFFYENHKLIVKNLKKAGIIPIVPYETYNSFSFKKVVCHFKEIEIVNMMETNDFNQLKRKLKKFTPFSVSCHDFDFAVKVLEAGAEFIFVSPVFHPISKPDDNRECFPLEKIGYLVTLYNEKIVLLGGITKTKLIFLKEKLTGVFGVAGITMFFG